MLNHNNPKEIIRIIVTLHPPETEPFSSLLQRGLLTAGVLMSAVTVHGSRIAAVIKGWLLFFQWTARSLQISSSHRSVDIPSGARTRPVGYRQTDELDFKIKFSIDAVLREDVMLPDATSNHVCYVGAGGGLLQTGGRCSFSQWTENVDQLVDPQLLAQPSLHCWRCTSPPVEFTLCFTLTRENPPETLNLLHPRQWPRWLVTSWWSQEKGEPQPTWHLGARLQLLSPSLDWWPPSPLVSTGRFWIWGWGCRGIKHTYERCYFWESPWEAEKSQINHWGADQAGCSSQSSHCRVLLHVLPALPPPFTLKISQKSTNVYKEKWKISLPAHKW